MVLEFVLTVGVLFIFTLWLKSFLVGILFTARPPTAPYPFTSVCICARRDIFYYHSSDNFE